MRLKTILAIPFAVTADLATLGNVGSVEGGFTQQLFDQEARHQRDKDAIRALEAAARILQAKK